MSFGLSLLSVDALAAPPEEEDPAAPTDAPEDAAAPAATPEDPAAPSDSPAPDEPEDPAAPTDTAAEPSADEPAVDSSEPEPEPAPEPESAPADGPIRPPRFDGPYVGVLAMGTANFPSVLNHTTPTPLFGGGGFVQAGDAVFPWMSIGIAVGGQAAWVGKQQMFEGSLLVEFGFVPSPRYPLSLRAGFGFGGGALKEEGIDGRSGFGGALFKGSFRYEFFPLAERKRPDRGGGWAIGPELGWLGATPAGKGQPFVNTVLLGLSTSFYFGG